MTRSRAIAELLVAAVIWGFGFIATRWALEDIGPMWITALRNLLAFAIAAPFLAVVFVRERKKLVDEFRLAAPAGVFLSASLILQTIGLKYTTATNSSFITVLYVLFVPIVSALVFKARLTKGHVACVLLSLFGAALICQPNDPSAGFQFPSGLGDLLTLGCALFASFQIVWLSRIGDRVASPFVLNMGQAFAAGIFALGFAIAFEPLPSLTHLSLKGFAGLFFLTAISTFVAFLLQVRAQRVLDASLSSLLCLLESPFGALFAFLLLAERLSTLQWSGALLIMVATTFGVLVDTKRSRQQMVSSSPPA